MANFSIAMSSSFVCLYCAKSKISATAAKRHESSSRSELESVIVKDTFLSVRVEFFFMIEASTSCQRWLHFNKGGGGERAYTHSRTVRHACTHTARSHTSNRRVYTYPCPLFSMFRRLTCWKNYMQTTQQHNDDCYQKAPLPPTPSAHCTPRPNTHTQKQRKVVCAVS